MKKWVILALAAVLVAGAAFALRSGGVDVASYVAQARQLIEGDGAGAKDDRATAAAPAGQQRANRGPLPVETAQATGSRLSEDISAIGTLLAEESVSIAPETSGRVAEILFQEGDRVAAGTALFKLDAELANAALSEARARLELAEATFTRNQTLRKSGAVAQSTFEAAQTEREVALAAVQSSEVLLEKLTITAPFPGTLGFRSVSEGAYVTAGTALVQLDKVDRLKVEFSIPELQQALVKPGQSIAFTADALPGETYAAVVSALNPSIDVNGRSLQVRADFDNAAGALRPGLLVRIVVKGPERQSVTVPEAALVRRGDTIFVYTVRDNKASEVAVRIGKRLPGRIEILDGIAPGDVVVTAGNSRLSDGATVELVSTAAAAEVEQPQ